MSETNIVFYVNYTSIEKFLYQDQIGVYFDFKLGKNFEGYTQLCLPLPSQ